MIIPVRCFTCGKVIGNKWETYLYLLQADYSEGWACRCEVFHQYTQTQTGDDNLCCRECVCAGCCRNPRSIIHRSIIADFEIFLDVSLAQPKLAHFSPLLNCLCYLIRDHDWLFATMADAKTKGCTGRTWSAPVLLSKNDVDACWSHWKIVEL